MNFTSISPDSIAANNSTVFTVASCPCHPIDRLPAPGLTAVHTSRPRPRPTRGENHIFQHHRFNSFCLLLFQEDTGSARPCSPQQTAAMERYMLSIIAWRRKTKNNSGENRHLSKGRKPCLELDLQPFLPVLPIVTAS